MGFSPFSMLADEFFRAIVVLTRAFPKMQNSSDVRSMNCASPGMASELVPKAFEGCVLRVFAR
eukprot:12586460-Alexandrium_andersonii.AAC.1